MLENDGKNALQLLKWAHLERHLSSLMMLRTRASPRPIENDATVYALTLWLLWMTSSRGIIIILERYDYLFDVLSDT